MSTDQVGRASWDGDWRSARHDSSSCFSQSSNIWGGSLPSVMPASRLTDPHAEGDSLFGWGLGKMCLFLPRKKIKDWQHSSHGNQSLGRANLAKRRNDRTPNDFERLSPAHLHVSWIYLNTLSGLSLTDKHKSNRLGLSHLTLTLSRDQGHPQLWQQQSTSLGRPW